MKKKKIVQLSNTKLKKPGMNRYQWKQSLILAVVLMVIITVTGLLPPLYTTLGEGKYINLGENSEGNTEWIAAGSEEDHLAGRFFKIDKYSHESGKPASDFEVIPSGFPISSSFCEEWYKGEFGVYGFNIYMLLVDFVFWFLLSIGIVVYFYPKTKEKMDKRKKPRAVN